MHKMKNKKRKYRAEEELPPLISPEIVRGIVIVILFTFAVISLLSFLNSAGVAGFYLNKGLNIAFGWTKYLFSALCLGFSYVLTRPAKYPIHWHNYFGALLLLVGVGGIIHLVQINQEKSFQAVADGLGGGFVGFVGSYFLQTYFGMIASGIILVAVIFGSIILAFNISLHKIFDKEFLAEKLAALKSPSENVAMAEQEATQNVEDEDEESEASAIKFIKRQLPQEQAVMIKPRKIKIDLPLDLLDNRIEKPRSGDVQAAKERIQKTLANFNIPVDMGDISVGPTVTQYTLKPADGIKLSKITTLSSDLALALAAHPIRIEAPIPGKALVGIEVPNQKIATVHIRELLEHPDFKHRESSLTIGLGKDVSGKPQFANLQKMPHLLIAGATGSGKSMGIHSMIITMLYQNNPETLRMLLVDPKRVEFTAYNGVPHLLTPVITDVTKTINALRWVISEMDRRFDILAKNHKRNIDSYNLTAAEKMPYIVIVVDELADLMVSAAAEVEACVIRLTQMARAVGIHLILATQRPSVDVITGLIKANMPTRIAYSVASLVDSRTILDGSGAEKLVGKGDMLYMSPTLSKPKRLQGAFVSDDEIKKVTKFLKDASGNEQNYQEEILEKHGGGGSSMDFYSSGGADGDGDALFNDAKEVVIQAGRASASLLQRRLRVGYARAARLIDLMEAAGFVGPADGARPREVLADSLQELPSQRIYSEIVEQQNATPFKSRTIAPIQAIDDSEEVIDEVDEEEIEEEMDEDKKLLEDLDKDDL
ncbi:MAG: DNA translocase FtsK 4TM domain-containing protein [Candidatus Falkowbacteria bacterium]